MNKDQMSPSISEDSLLHRPTTEQSMLLSTDESELKSTGVDSTMLSEIQIISHGSETSSVNEGLIQDGQESEGLPLDQTVYEKYHSSEMEDNMHTPKFNKIPIVDIQQMDDQVLVSEENEFFNSKIDKVSTSQPAYEELAADYGELVTIDRYFRTFSAEATEAQVTAEASGDEEEEEDEEDEEHPLGDEHLPYYVQSENEAVQQTVSYDAQTGCMWVCPVPNP